MSFLTEYGLFLLKAFTIFLVLFLFFSAIIAVASKKKKDKPEGNLTIKNINEKFDDLQETLYETILTKSELKDFHKKQKEQKKNLAKEIKQAKKAKKPIPQKPRIFVIDFDGDTNASEADALQEEINAILTVASSKDEVLVDLKSYGGTVPDYGFAASQLQRLRDNNIMLTVAINKVAASGGYLMACVANTILAAPFAIVGSIGVVAELPNFFRLLKRHHIDYKQITAGEYKRTINLFAENTREGLKKAQADVNTTHRLFKAYIQKHRPQTPIDTVATGEYWHANDALELQLVDRLITSNAYLLDARKRADIYEVRYEYKQSLVDKLSDAIHSSAKTAWRFIQLQNKKNQLI